MLISFASQTMNDGQGENQPENLPIVLTINKFGHNTDHNSKYVNVNYARIVQRTMIPNVIHM